MDRVKALRLDRLLANMGYGSRSDVKKLIRSGKVTVNGEVQRDEAEHIRPDHDRVSIAGTEVNYRQFLYLMLNKPAGVISATSDATERTVLDLIEPAERNKGLFPVGRLDKDTEGLLVLTNAGDLGHRLLAPKKHVPKRYIAVVSGKVTPEDIRAFHDGIRLDDGYLTLSAKLEPVQPGDPEKGDPAEVIVEIHEGKYHQIKRMMTVLGKKVLYLKRISMGGLMLDPDLKPGEYRELSAAEIQLLQNES